MRSTTRLSPTICDNFAYAQLIESQVMRLNEPTGSLTPSSIKKGSSGFSGFGKVHGSVPSMRSSLSTPASSAAARMNIFTLEPVCRRRIARFTSFSPALNGLPPTIARIAPVELSMVTSAACAFTLLSGKSFTASSALACTSRSSVVYIRRPPRNNLA